MKVKVTKHLLVISWPWSFVYNFMQRWPSVLKCINSTFGVSGFHHMGSLSQLIKYLESINCGGSPDKFCKGKARLNGLWFFSIILAFNAFRSRTDNFTCRSIVATASEYWVPHQPPAEKCPVSSTLIRYMKLYDFAVPLSTPGRYCTNASVKFWSQ